MTEWRRLGLPFNRAAVVVAVSGGADSVSLLLALEDLKKRNKLELDLIVAHFDHGLRGEASTADAEFVGTLAERLGFKFELGRERVARSGNLEENARRARYGFLEKAARRAGAGIVLTAHTINDQAETFLMNLIRGSGPEGLMAMPAIRPLGKGDARLARPLLGWARREDTEEYCSAREIEPRRDAMNEDEAFTRVRIRRAVLPLLREINPKIVETLARTAVLMAETEGGNASGSGEDDLLLKRLAGLDDGKLNTALRGWIKRRRGNLRALELKHIEGVARLARSRKSGRTAELPGGGRVIKRSGRLVFEPNAANKEENK